MDEKEDFNKDFEEEKKEEGTENREDEVSKKNLKDVSGGFRTDEETSYPQGFDPLPPPPPPPPR